MVRLVPMDEADYQTWLGKLVRAYAEDNVRAGYWSEEDALALSEADVAKLLPNGLSTENHHLLSVQDGPDNTKVGTLWFALMGKSAHPPAFIYDFEIFEEFRRRGYGMQALSALDQMVKAMGLNTILLHVFAHNPTAMSLYERAGYVVSSVNMRKELDASDT